MKLLIDEKGRKHLVEGGKVHTDLGVVDVDETESNAVKSHLGKTFYILDPRNVDIYEKMPRAGSFMLKKDIGLILAYTGVGSGDVVVDAGTGSGALALFLANIVKPKGRVYTYEIREDAAEIARKNIAKAGLQDFVEVKVKDVTEGIDEKADVVTLDLAEPWRVSGLAFKALKTGGFIAVYNPYVENAKKTAESLGAEGFRDIKTVEVIEREIEFRKQGTRPKTVAVGHTAYLTFARKLT